MRRFVLLTCCALHAAGCASPVQFQLLTMKEWNSLEPDVDLQPGQWCQVQLKTERVDPQTQEMRVLWGRVERIEDDTLSLVDVMEEKRLITAQPFLRQIPYFSRLTTSLESEVELLEKREIPRQQIIWSMVVPAEVVAQTREALVPAGEKWVRGPQGIDFDFVISSQ